MIAGKIYSRNHCYQVREILGEGGYGCVYLVRCLEDGCSYALKVSLPDEVSKHILRHEGGILASVRCPAFPSVKEIWETEQFVYLVMTFISGSSLSVKMQERMFQKGRGFEPDEILPWMMQLTECLEELHRHRMIYCDLKPSNVILGGDERIFLIDFGAAVILDEVQEQSQSGTPGFAPPEQYSRTSRPGVWTDVYSLGALMHFLLTGIHPAANMFHFQHLNVYLCSNDKLKYGEQVFKDRQIRKLNHLIWQCTRSDPRQRCSMEDIRKQLFLCRTSVIRQNGIWLRRVVLGALGVFLIVYLSLTGVDNRLLSSAYERELLQAEDEEPERAEEVLLEQIEMMPEKIEGYMLLLELYLTDDVLTMEEWQKLQQLLMMYRVNNGSDEAEWVIVSYRIAMALYMQSDRRISENQATDWFQIVEKADMQRLDLGASDSRKLIWQKRAAIFRRWSQLHVDKNLNSSESDIENQRFWHEAEILLEDEFYQEESRWEWGMYDQILNRMMEELVVGLKHQYVSRRKVCAILDQIHSYIEKVKEEEVSTEKIRDILETEKILRKRLAMVDEE